MRSLFSLETLPACSLKGSAPVAMDHTESGEEHKSRSSLHQQQQSRSAAGVNTGRQQQQQQQQQHWGQQANRGLNVPVYGSGVAGVGDSGARRHQHYAQQNHPLPAGANPAMAAAGMMQGGVAAAQQEIDYHARVQAVYYGQQPQQPPHGYPNSQQVPYAGYIPGHLAQQSGPASTIQQQMAMRQPQQQQPMPAAQQQPYIQPTAGRLPADRPIVKLSVSLIDTYKQINKVYYEEREARRAARVAQRAAAPQGQGINNNGWDDENYDYIVSSGEMFYERYVIKERIGKGSFGQVVSAFDTESNKDVAIKIIKSKKPFQMQAKTEIELLTHLCDKDRDDQHNIVRLTTHFMFRNHQCLVFEMLSLNLYELLKNTQFGGVSLNLIRKFAKQILKALSFLARPDVDIIHCDLKPENILLRHPKRSGVKVIDFGSSCKSNKRMYSYIQSRFYRSPEVMLGLPYSVAIDMWSLGCILVEMHTGEPLFSGSDQVDQMQKIVKILGMVPDSMLAQSSDQHRLQFFEKAGDRWELKQQQPSSSSSRTGQKNIIVPSTDPVGTLAEVIGAETNRKKKHPSADSGHSSQNYETFVDLIYKMLAYKPEQRLKPHEALNHPFIASVDSSQSSGQQSGMRRRQAEAPQVDEVMDGQTPMQQSSTTDQRRPADPPENVVSRRKQGR